MATSINKVTILGILGQDPEIKTVNGTIIANLVIATDERYKNKNTNEWTVITEWHKVICWGELANYVHTKMFKGSKVYVEGKLKYSTYEKKGITQYRTDIYANSIIILTNPKENKLIENETKEYETLENEEILEDKEIIPTF